MKIFADLHLHSCLSPCGDGDMTPYNLVNMAALLGYQLIALTDHNTCRNTPAAVRAGEQAGLPVAPGMELTTAEDAHVVCLFPTVEDAFGFQEEVERRRVRVPNRPEIFGNQFIMDSEDHVLGEEPDLLINATSIGAGEALALARRFHGTAFPAHVDKDAYSLIASLGAIPPETGFAVAELSHNAQLHRLLRSNPELGGMTLLRNSDAHYLENMPDPSAWIELEEPSAACLVETLNRPGKVTGAW